MANQRKPVWLDQIERFGVKSLVKLVLAVFALWFFVVLASFLPGTDRLRALLPTPVTGIVSAVVTLAIIVLLYKIATQANTIIYQIRTGSPAFRDCIAAVVYWGVILLAVVISYVGFSTAGGYVFGYAGFELFYPLFFVIMAVIPLTLILVEVAVFVRAQRESAVDAPVERRELRPDTARVHDYLEEHDGMVYQGELVAGTGWSKSKVSRVLSGMETDGLVTRFQVGRQKVVCLPGHEPDLFSPRDDGSREP